MESLEIETRDGLQRVSLDKPRMTIGRLPGNDIVLPFAQISRHHAELRQRGQEWWVIDLGSTNGLRVNNRVIKEYMLHPGDHVVLAPTIMLHFISTRPGERSTVEGTLELPALGGALPKSKAAATLRTVPQPAVLAEPPDKSVSEIASSAAMPMPRRKMGMTPPPLTPTPRASYGLEPMVPPSTPLLTDDALDTWLNDQKIESAAFDEGVSPLAVPPKPRGAQPSAPDVMVPAVVPPPPAGAPPAPAGRELPLSSPFALMRQANATPGTAPKKPLLATCPTCGERTAPDSPYCWSCHHTIAQQCRVCHLYLLPIQSKCPRCETPNANGVRR